MKICCRLITAIALCCLATIPANAATYNAAGEWFITTDPGQTISLFGNEIAVPDASLNATITQTGDFFTMETEEIARLGNISYSGSGSISGDQYTFDPPLAESLNLEEIIGLPFSVSVSLDGFMLTSDTDVVGEFTIDTLQQSITFSGSKNAVPLPATVWFLGTGLIGLIGVRKRAKTT